MCQEKPDLRLCYGFHHQCHAYRSQSDAAERHGVTTCTVSMGSGQNSHDLTSSCLCSQSWTSHNPSTSLNNQFIFYIFYFILFYFILFYYFIKFNFIWKVPCRCRQCELKEERYICFALKMSPYRVTGLTGRKKKSCFYINYENK